MTLVYLDTETTGLDPNKHEVWQIAYAIDGDDVRTSHVAHHGLTADATALEMNHYFDEMPLEKLHGANSQMWEWLLFQNLHDATLVGANPSFDAAFLANRWGKAPWRFRLLDVEAYAMGALGFDEPRGLATISNTLRDQHGYEIPSPDHTAAGDVAALRACHLALQSIYVDLKEN